MIPTELDEFVIKEKIHREKSLQGLVVSQKVTGERRETRHKKQRNVSECKSKSGLEIRCGTSNVII